MSVWATAAAAGVFFVLSDLVYTLDHYLVHHDHERYRVTHGRHHRRYNGSKDAPQLDSYELSTYTSAAVVSALGMSVLSLLTGNWGFFLGAVIKYVHSLLCHLYEHKWWGQVPLRKQNLGKPSGGWGIVSARYHAYHHTHPDDGLFTYAETWKGFDRLLEWAHPVLVNYTVDGAKKRAKKTGAPQPAEGHT
ncbi:MAG: sterol desaturase family protein [Polyangiaceae bacterium]